MVQKASHQPLTGEAQGWSQTSACGPWGGESDIGTGPAPRTLVSHQLTFHTCSMLIMYSYSLHPFVNQNHNLFYFIFLEVDSHVLAQNVLPCSLVYCWCVEMFTNPEFLLKWMVAAFQARFSLHSSFHLVFCLFYNLNIQKPCNLTPESSPTSKSICSSHNWHVFLHPSRLAWGPSQPPVLWVLGLFPGVKQTVHAIEHPPLSSTEVTERVQLHLYLYTTHSTCAQGQQLMLKHIHLQIMYFRLAENVLSITLAHTHYVVT